MVIHLVVGKCYSKEGNMWIASLYYKKPFCVALEHFVSNNEIEIILDITSFLFNRVTLESELELLRSALRYAGDGEVNEALQSLDYFADECNSTECIFTYKISEEAI